MLFRSGAAHPSRGVDRRITLAVMKQTAREIANIRINERDSFDEIKAAIVRFEEHARALLDVAAAAHSRMIVAECLDSTPDLSALRR